MPVNIATSIDISKEEEDFLRGYFPEESFEIKKSVFTPGVDSTFLILNFVVSAVAGGVLYDLFKGGILKLYQSYKNRPGRELTITIKYKDKFYRIKGNEVSKMSEDGSYVPVDEVNEIFIDMENDSEF
ncbi:MAG: hypothetical protein KDC69_08885 [Flavobacteriaceae bacterium]|nr:hypothetical protein [Flavobacteriaceae bacterium]MCB0705285.1 hypothetical protein [Saprospiraceae bacterium]